MADLSSQQIDRRLEAERLPVGWPWQFLLFSGFLFLIAIVAYFGLSVGYTAFLRNDIDSIKKQMDDLGLRVNAEEQAEFINFYSQLNNLHTLFQSHVALEKIFVLIQEKAVAKTAIASLQIDVPSRTVTIDATADSFATLASQITSYQQADILESVDLENSRLAGGSVQFTVSLVFKPEAFLTQ
jgi:hypothetical protein